VATGAEQLRESIVASSARQAGVESSNIKILLNSMYTIFPHLVKPKSFNFPASIISLHS
jgi:hypothetical protein